jgi:FdhD protein
VAEGRGSKEADLLAVRGGAPSRRRDALAVEEPLEVRVEGPRDGGAPPAEVRIAVTMRTPGHDEELAVGFLYTEGLVKERADVADRPVRELLVAAGGNIATVCLTRPFDATRLQRNFYATSSCGICGKAALEHLEVTAPHLAPGPVVTRSVLLTLPPTLRAAQAVFEQTGGLHATGLFTPAGRLLLVREDVGRHNAMDKVIGRALLDGDLPLREGVLLVSGRVSFELVQKAAMAAVPILCAVSAPSSLAVQTAERLGMTIVGFLRGESFNVYTRPERIDVEH